MPGTLTCIHPTLRATSTTLALPGHGMDAPWLIDAPWDEDLLSGYVIVPRDPPRRYWTGSIDPTRQWSMNPSRALIDLASPWDLHVPIDQIVNDGRCVRVLLETESTMLPLRHWPRSPAQQGATARVDRPMRGATLTQYRPRSPPAHRPRHRRRDAARRPAARPA